MSVVETVLVFVVVPAVIVGVIALLIWGAGGSGGPRYRPGRDWPYEPVWYAPHPLAVPEPEHDAPRARHPELAAAEPAPATASDNARTAAGGARGIW